MPIGRPTTRTCRSSQGRQWTTNKPPLGVPRAAYAYAYDDPPTERVFSGRFAVFQRFSSRQGFNDPDEQLKVFVLIVDKYLLSTSPDEINISSSTRQRINSLRPR